MSKKKITGKDRLAILQARERAGLTLDELAKKIGVSGPTISRWESGETSTIKDRDAGELKRVLGISLAGSVRA